MKNRKNIVIGCIKNKKDNMLYVVVKTAKYNIEYIIDCGFVVKNTNKANVYFSPFGFVPLDLQECGTNVFVYNNANIGDSIKFDISAARYKGNRTYYVPANSGWDDKHAFSKSSVIALAGQNAIDLVPNWYKKSQTETRMLAQTPFGPAWCRTNAFEKRANRVREHMEHKNDMRIQKILKVVRQR